MPDASGKHAKKCTSRVSIWFTQQRFHSFWATVCKTVRPIIIVYYTEAAVQYTQLEMCGG